MEPSTIETASSTDVSISVKVRPHRRSPLMCLRIVIAVAVVICLGTVVLALDQGKPVATTQIEARINGQRWSGDLNGIAKRPIIRILVVPTALGLYFNGKEMQ